MVDGVVAEHGPQNVESATSEGEDGLFVALAFKSLALVEGARLQARADRYLRGQVHRSEQASVVPPGTPQVSVDPSGITRLWCQAGESGELVDAGERVHVTPGSSEELRTECGTETGQTHDDLGGVMLAKPLLDRGVEFGDFRVQDNHPLRDTGDHLRAHCFSGQTDVLRSGRSDGFRCQDRCTTNVLFTQPRLDPGDSGATDRARRLEAGQQDQWALVRQRQGSFHRWADFQQLGPEAVDLPGAVEDHVEAASGQDTEIYGYLVAGPQQADVSADTSLVGDDERIPRIGLALTSIPGRSPVHHQAGQIRHRLTAGRQQPDHQCSATSIEVDRPQHFATICQGKHLVDQDRQRSLIVSDPGREQPLTGLINHHAMVMLFTDIDSSPQLVRHQRHPSIETVPRSCGPLTTASPAQSYSSDESRFSISSRVVAGLRAAMSFEQSVPHRNDSHTRSPQGLSDLMNDQIHPHTRR